MSDFTFLFLYSCKYFSSVISLFTIILLHGTVLPSEADGMKQYETKLEGITKGDTGFTFQAHGGIDCP